MPSLFVWHVWPGQGWPASADQELAFVEDLRDVCPPAPEPATRASVTCLLGALRTGMTLRQLRTALPGVVPAQLLASYELLEHRRSAAETSWRSLVGAANTEALAEHAALAGLLLPVPVQRIATGAATARGPHGLGRVVLDVAAHVSSMCEQSDTLEESLRHLPAQDPRGVHLGAQLHNPLEPALWSEPYFLASRVGALSPTRVADLLGERRGVEAIQW